MCKSARCSVWFAHSEILSPNYLATHNFGVLKILVALAGICIERGEGRRVGFTDVKQKINKKLIKTLPG